MDFKPWWPPSQQRRGEGTLLPFHGTTTSESCVDKDIVSGNSTVAVMRVGVFLRLPGPVSEFLLEWVAISFSNALMHAKSLQSCLTLCDPHGL